MDAGSAHRVVWRVHGARPGLEWMTAFDRDAQIAVPRAV